MSISDYQVIEQVETPEGVFPLVDIPMMSDERWNELANLQQALIEELDKKLKTEGEQEQSRDKLSRPVWQQTKRKDF